MKTLFIAILLCLLPLSLQAKRLHKESWYQDQHCQGQTDIKLADGTEADCLTDTHAIEYDFGNKWAEAIGQSLHYAFQTNKRAGIVLILEKPSSIKYWYRLNSIIQHNQLPIDTCMLSPAEKLENCPNL